jgi:vacuolar protein 8
MVGVHTGVGANRKKLASTEPKLVQSLVALMDSPSLKVQCQAALALRNLASDGEQ